MPKAAKILAPFNDFLHGDMKGKALVTRTPQARRAFEASKESLVQASLLTHPRTNAEFALFTNASTIGATLQQRNQDSWEPLAFFSKRLNPAKYSAFDRDLFWTIYLSVKYFRHILGVRTFTIYRLQAIYLCFPVETKEEHAAPVLPSRLHRSIHD